MNNPFVVIFSIFCFLISCSVASATTGKANVDQLTYQAEGGDADAQFNLAKLYLYGEGVEKDTLAGLRLLTNAAELGHVEAQLFLGMLYIGGSSLAPEDHRKAASWMQKAAEQGHPEAQWHLGVFYYTGMGVPENLLKAYAWLNISAAQGQIGAEGHRAEVRALLSPDALIKAQELSDEYFEKYVVPFQ